MTTVFLLVIYLAFISLGLSDSLLGVAWPVMQPELGIPYGFAGILAMFISGGTILSSLFSGRIIRRFRTGNVMRISVLMTAFALMGFAIAPSFGWILFLTIPLGLGAGAVDVVLNSYVAAHYKAHHMNWLHCFWGIGAMAGPMILSGFIANGLSWRSGYLVVSVVQFCLTGLLFASIPLWKRSEPPDQELSAVDLSLEPAQVKIDDRLHVVLKIWGVKPVLLVFLLYCGMESTAGLWGSTFLIRAKGLDVATAALWISIFYGSITLGRLVSGFVSFRVKNRNLIRGGILTVLAGTVLLLIPLPAPFSAIGFPLIGLGCAPIFPSLLHETPRRFGVSLAASIMGIQMAAAYIGATFLPPVFGFVTSGQNLVLLPIVFLVFGAVILGCTERVNKLIL